MHFKISKKVFYESLDDVYRAVSTNSPIPALSGIKITVYENQIELIASDSDISIKKYINKDEDSDLQILDQGAIVIEARYILDIVRKIDASIIDVEILDGSLTRFSGNSTEFNINGINTKDYPHIDFSKPEDVITINSNELQKLITQTSFAASDSENRPILTGVNISVDAGKLKFVATDSYRLARKEIATDTTKNINFTLPAASLTKVARIIDKNIDIEIATSDKKVQFIFDDLIIQNRLIDGMFPETNKLIPTAFSTTIEIDSRDLLNAIDRASFIKHDGVSIVNFQLGSDKMIVSSKSQEVGSSIEEITNYKFEGEPIKISFSGRYVYEAIRATDGSELKISFSGEMSPFIITDVKNDSITHLILPVRTIN